MVKLKPMETLTVIPPEHKANIGWQLLCDAVLEEASTRDEWFYAKTMAKEMRFEARYEPGTVFYNVLSHLQEEGKIEYLNHGKWKYVNPDDEDDIPF